MRVAMVESSGLRYAWSETINGPLHHGDNETKGQNRKM